MTYSNMDNVPTQTAGTSELLASDWNTYVKDNFNDIKAGHIVCTSSTRPTGVVEGVMIYETDTNKVLVYDGSTWDEVHDLDNTANLPDGGAALSVIGNGTNATAARTDIAAGTDGHVLRRSGTSLGFGTIGTANMDSSTANTINQGHQILTTAQRNALTGVTVGTMIYCSDLYGGANGGAVQYWNGSAWLNVNGVVVPPTIATNGGAATANTLGLVPFSGVTSISLNNCFSANYDSYALSIRLSSTAAVVWFTFRSGGVDVSAANSYYVQYMQSSQTSNTAAMQTTGTALILAVTSATNFANAQINYPYQAATTTFVDLRTVNITTTPVTSFQFQSGRERVAGSRDGLTLYSTGAFSGDVRVIGIAN